MKITGDERTNVRRIAVLLIEIEIFASQFSRDDVMHLRLGVRMWVTFFLVIGLEASYQKKKKKKKRILQHVEMNSKLEHQRKLSLQLYKITGEKRGFNLVSVVQLKLAKRN
jgi:hypothetical protein